MRIIVNCADTLYKRVFPNSRQVELLDDIPAFELLGGWDLCICGFLYVVIVFFSRLVTSDWNQQQKSPWKCPEINPINSQKSHEIPMSFPRFFCVKSENSPWKSWKSQFSIEFERSEHEPGAGYDNIDLKACEAKSVTARRPNVEKKELGQLGYELFIGDISFL